MPWGESISQWRTISKPRCYLLLIAAGTIRSLRIWLKKQTNFFFYYFITSHNILTHHDFKTTKTKKVIGLSLSVFMFRFTSFRVVRFDTLVFTLELVVLSLVSNFTISMEIFASKVKKSSDLKAASMLSLYNCPTLENYPGHTLTSCVHINGSCIQLCYWEPSNVWTGKNI